MRITESQLRRIIREQLDPEQTVLVRGIGTMRVGQLQDDVRRKLEDMLERADAGQYSTIGREQFSVLESMWQTLADLEE